MPPRIFVLAGVAAAPVAALLRGSLEDECSVTALPWAGPYPPSRRRVIDLLDADLALRPSAVPLALLAAVARATDDDLGAGVVVTLPSPRELLALIEAADLARSTLAAGRPAAGATTIAAAEAGRRPTLELLRSAASAGDLLRCAAFTRIALLNDDAGDAAGLALVGLPEPTELTAATPAEQAAALFDSAAGASRAPRVEPTWEGVSVAMPAIGGDLRAVRSGDELVVRSGDAVARLRSPGALGELAPSEVEHDGATLIAQFTERATRELGA